MWRQVTTQVLTTQVLTTWWQEGLPCASALRGPGSGPRPPRRTSLDLPSGTRLSRALGQGQGPTLCSPVARPYGRLATAPRRPESLYQHGVIKGASLPTGERAEKGREGGRRGQMQAQQQRRSHQANALGGKGAGRGRRGHAGAVAPGHPEPSPAPAWEGHTRRLGFGSALPPGLHMSHLLETEQDASPASPASPVQAPCKPCVALRPGAGRRARPACSPRTLAPRRGVRDPEDGPWVPLSRGGPETCSSSHCFSG